MRCGSHRWSISGPFLTIEHEVRPIDGWLSRGALLAAVAFPLISWATGFLSGDWQLWFLMLALGVAAAHHLGSRWKVLLNLETRTLWRRTGYTELGGQTQPLEPFTSVALIMRGRSPATDGPLFAKVYSVALKTPTTVVVLSHSDDREEALELAQAASRFLGLGLSVEGGHSRAVTARLEETPLTEKGIPDLPYGSDIRFTQGARGLTVELPPCGWQPTYAGQGAFAVLIGLGGPLFLGVQWRRAFGPQWFSSTVPLIATAIFVSCGALMLWRVAWVATSGSTLNVSSRGLELTHHGPWRRKKVLRLPASRIQDIDLRDARTDVSQRGRGIVIEHDQGTELLGMDLSQEELEWTEKVLRGALATRSNFEPIRFFDQR